MHYMPSQTYLTVAEAAVRVNKSRQTLFDKIKRGQLSATVNHDGIKVIEVSELLRVFGSLLSDDQMALNQANKTGQAAPTALTSTLQLELERTKMQLEMANERYSMLKESTQELKEENQLLKTWLDRQMLLLAAPKAKPAARAKPAAKAAPAPAPVVKKAAPKVLAKVVAKPATRTKAKPAAVKKTVAKPAAKVVKKATRK